MDYRCCKCCKNDGFQTVDGSKCSGCTGNYSNYEQACTSSMHEDLLRYSGKCEHCGVSIESLRLTEEDGFDINRALVDKGNCSNQKCGCEKCKMGALIFKEGLKRSDELCDHKIVYTFAKVAKAFE